MIIMGVFLKNSFLCILFILISSLADKCPVNLVFLCLTTVNQAQVLLICGGEGGNGSQTAEFCLLCLQMQGMQLFHFLNSNSNTGLRKKERKGKLDGWIFLQIKVQSSKAKSLETMYNRAFFSSHIKAVFMKLSWKYYKWEVTTE